MQDQVNPVVTLHVCVTCRRGDEPLEPKDGRSGFKMQLALAEAISQGQAASIDLRPAECLSGCKRGCAIALVAPGKWSYVIADLDPECHAADILTFAEQYSSHPTGVPAWSERPAIVKKSVLARVPPISLPGSEEAA